MPSKMPSGLLVRRDSDLIVYSHPFSSVLGIGLAYGGVFGLLHVVELHQPVSSAALIGGLALAAASGTFALLRYWLRVRIERDGGERVRFRASGLYRNTERETLSVAIQQSWPFPWQRDVVIVSEEKEMVAIRRLSRRTAERLRAELASELGLEDTTGVDPAAEAEC